VLGKVANAAPEIVVIELFKDKMPAYTLLRFGGLPHQ